MPQPSKFYHIYNHANGDDNLFREQRNYPFFLEKYRHHIDPIAETIAWCLMPNHFHLLVRIKDVAALQQDFPKFGTLENLENSEEKDKKLSYLLSKQFSNLFSSYTQSFNKVYQRRGSLFLKNFKRKEIIGDQHLQTVALYIHLNPIKHGFCTALNDWEWTSYHHFWKEQKNWATLIFTNEENYNKLHQEKQLLFENYQKIETYLLKE